MLDEIRRVALNGIQKDGATSAIFELSAVPFMDTQEFKSLRDIARMAAMLGSKVIFVGLNPGIIMHLMASDADSRYHALLHCRPYRHLLMVCFGAHLLLNRLMLLDFFLR
jgi:hypothetical protein